MAALKAGMRAAGLALALAATSPATATSDPLARWAPHVAEASARFGLPAEWIRRVIRAESGGRTALGGAPIVSRAGAMGLMQLMPATWAAMRARLGLGADPHDPRDNILAGTAYLRMMYDRFEAFRALSNAARMAWLGHCVAQTLEASLNWPGGRSCAFHDHLGEVLGIEVARWWRPTGANYFDRVPKAVALAALAEVGEEALSQRHAKAKKAELAHTCERLFAGELVVEADVRAAALAWVPEAMRFAPREAEPAESDEPDEAAAGAGDIGPGDGRAGAGDAREGIEDIEPKCAEVTDAEDRGPDTDGAASEPMEEAA